MSKPPAISKPEAREVLSAYDVGKLQFLRPGAGTANPAVIAVTTSGQYFLKRRNPRYCAPEQLRYDHAVIRHLAREGLPVVRPVLSRNGSRWVNLEDGVYELYPLVEGAEHEPGNRDQVSAAGRLLGQLHRATEGFSPGVEKPFPRLHDPRSTLNGLQWAVARLQTGAKSDHGDAGTVRQLIRVTKGIAERLPDAAYRALPGCVIHGDYHPANVKFRGDAVCGLFDFDWVGPGPRMVDVADGLIFFCSTRAKPMVPGNIASLTQAFTFDTALMAAFGAGYTEHVPMQPAELAALPDLIAARWLFCRVDAMERKIPPADKLDYLLEDIEGPLEQIETVAGALVSGEWLG